MQLLEVKNDIAKILYSPTEKQLLLSDFILLEDINQSLICQITEIESSSADSSNIATVRLSLSINKNSNLTTYNGYIPSKDANVIYISPQEIAQLIKSSKTNLYWGKLSSHTDVPIYIGLNFLRDKAYIRCDNIDNSHLLNANLIYNLQFNKKRTVVFDTEGCFRHIAPASVLTLGRDFRLPLNVQSFEFIATNDLTECSVESKAFIQGILIELEEYAQSLENKFIPFSLFKKVIEEQAKFDSIPELLILRNKILRYEQFGLFAETEEQFRIFNDYLAKSTITTIDASSVDEKYQKLILRIITSQINKKCYLIFNVNDYNTDKQTIAQIYDNSNIRPVVTSSYGYKYAPFLKSHCKNSVLFAPVDKRTDDDGYGLFQNKLRQKEFIVYGENTFYMPLILKLEAIDKNIFEKLLDDEIKDDVDKFIFRSSSKKEDNVIQNITDKDPSAIKFEAGTKKTPSIKPVNYVVPQTIAPVSENKQFSEILKEETLIDDYTSESEEKNSVYDITSQELQTEQITQDEDLDISDNRLPVSPVEIQQAYQEETGVKVNEIKPKDENDPDLIISDSDKETDDFLLNFTETDTIEPENTPEQENEVILQEQTKADEEQTEVLNEAEVLFEQVIKEPQPEIKDRAAENIPETIGIFDDKINFDTPDLSNIKLDFSSTTEINDLKKNNDEEELKTETPNNSYKDDITNDDLDFLDEYDGYDQEETYPAEEPKKSVIDSIVDKEKKSLAEETSDTDILKFEDDIPVDKIEEIAPTDVSLDESFKDTQTPDIFEEMIQSESNNKEESSKQEDSSLTFEDEEKVIPEEFTDITEDDEAILDEVSDDVVIIDNSDVIKEIDSDDEEEIDASSLMETFIEPPAEKPKEEPKTEFKTEQTEIIKPSVPTSIEQPKVEIDNTQTHSFVENIMPPEEVKEILSESKDEPEIQINKEPEVTENKTEQEFLKVVNQINKTNDIEAQKNEAEEAEESTIDENDDDKLFAAFNINESVQVRQDKLSTDSDSKRRIEHPKNAGNEQENDATRQNIPVYSAQNQNQKEEKEIDYEVGDWVFHPKYGKGQVESFAHYSNKILFCTILFDNFGRRTLDAKLTGLEKIK